MGGRAGHRLLSTGHRSLATGRLFNQGLVGGGSEEVAGVEVAFAPGFFGVLIELPIVEPGAKALANRLMLLGAIVEPQAVIRQSQCLRQLPTLAVVLRFKFRPLRMLDSSRPGPGCLWILIAPSMI